METNKKKCDSCAQLVDHTQTCKGIRHPEHGFCFEDMKFCSGCLNKKGYCDWCEKKRKEMKSNPDVQRLSQACAANAFMH